MQIVFFKTPKPKQFDFKPRYYNEEEERKEKRRKEMEQSGTGDTSFMKGEMNRRWRRADKKNHDRARGINLLVYIAIIGLLVYFVFFV